MIKILKRGSELRTRILSCKAGQHLPLKMIQLVQNFYELSVTSVTNIPMKVIIKTILTISFKFLQN